ncbi:MAG: DNA-3-methyladenine glycosylase family protein [Lachnospiraceae bacterium]
MIIQEISNFNLKQICNSGQCFRMIERKDRENSFFIIANNRYLELSQEGEKIYFSCSAEEFLFWEEYFDLNTNYKAYLDQIDPSDIYLVEAAKLASGMHILKQDLWEIIISFLISQQNNITRIRRCIQNICQQYGEKLTAENGTIYYSFPTATALSQATEEELRACNLGYRAKYVLKTAKDIASGDFSLEKLKKMNYEDAKKELLKLYGVGVKVADCICLYALHHLEAFPVDTHIKQALNAHYINGFPMERYSGIQGVMQQYIFYWELLH